nr:MAG TPA: hypothetical protein [Caudoviricetes sp.]
MFFHFIAFFLLQTFNENLNTWCLFMQVYAKVIHSC